MARQYVIKIDDAWGNAKELMDRLATGIERRDTCRSYDNVLEPFGF